MFLEYLTISAADLGKGQPVKVRVKGDFMSLAHDLADAMFAEIQAGERSGRGATLIVPVGPVDQYPLLAQKLNQEKLSCPNTLLINMDEYLTDESMYLPRNHLLSFRGYMMRAFYGLLDGTFVSPRSVFPDPLRPEALQTLIASRGGVDACFGGIGINGHIAFNEPPEPGQKMSAEEFAALPTRVVSLSRETRTINAVTVGGEISVIPKCAVTVGMKEILAARRLRFYCNRHWQSGVVRRALHGRLTPACPASFLRTHPDACVTVADYVSAPPSIQLR
jgi:glucosamine-6-phosphate deaminase